MGLDKFNYNCDGQLSLFDVYSEQMNVKRDWASEYLTEALLTQGSQDLKKKIYELFKNTSFITNRISKIKEAYGICGMHWGTSKNKGLCGVDFLPYGVEISYRVSDGSEQESKRFTWEEVEKRLHRLVDQGKYYVPVENRPVCEHSKHVCNKQEIWAVADSLSDKDKCPHVCCRACTVKGCGARCNGSSEPETDFYYCAPLGKWDHTCATCNNWHFHRTGVRCRYGNCPENGYENYTITKGGHKRE